MKTLAKVLMVFWLVASFVQSEGAVSPSPESPNSPTPETPIPNSPAPETPSPNSPAPETPSPNSPAPETPSPISPAPETPSPNSPAPETPSPNSPAPETPSPNSPAPETPSPNSPAPETPSPNSPAPETPSPNSPAPETPSPNSPAPETPSPNSPAPETPSPNSPAPETPSPNTPAPETPSPNTPAPETPSPNTPAPETPSSNTPAPETPSPNTPVDGTTALSTPAQGTPSPNTAESPATDASTPPSTTSLPDPCIPNLCPPNSRCEKRFDNYTCLCLPGLVLQDNVCKTSKVFTGDLRINQTFIPAMADKTSKEFKGTSDQIVAKLQEVLNGTDGYITSTVLSLRKGSVVAEVENVYDLSSEATDASVSKEIANAANCSDCFFAGATLKTTELCSATACDPISTECSAPDGVLNCECKAGYVKTSFTDRSCTICPSGKKAVNNECVSCSFGYSGVNCQESYLLAVVVVSCVLGGLMLILLIVLIVICCRKSKKAPVKSSPYVDMDFRNPTVPKIPRANANSKGWEPTNLELAESGSTRALFTPDRQGNGMKNFKDQNVSGMAYRTHGHVNPYYENNEDQQRRY